MPASSTRVLLDVWVSRQNVIHLPWTVCCECCAQWEKTGFIHIAQRGGERRGQQEIYAQGCSSNGWRAVITIRLDSLRQDSSHGTSPANQRLYWSRPCPTQQSLAGQQECVQRILWDLLAVLPSIRVHVVRTNIWMFSRIRRVVDWTWFNGQPHFRE